MKHVDLYQRVPVEWLGRVFQGLQGEGARDAYPGRDRPIGHRDAALEPGRKRPKGPVRVMAIKLQRRAGSSPVPPSSNS